MGMEVEGPGVLATRAIKLGIEEVLKREVYENHIFKL